MPSVWKAWMVRCLKAAMVSSTKPLSFRVSVWIATAMSISSATVRQVSIAWGVAPAAWVGLGSAVDLLGTYAGRKRDLAKWLEKAEINRDRNLRLQYLYRDFETALTSADLVGVMRGVLDVTVAYAAERRQYGVPVGSFQAVQHLLGNVVVVENIDVAVGLQRRGIRTRYVTLDGEMVASSGAMTGGNMKVAGLLNRTREVKELADRLQTLPARRRKPAK